MSLEKLGGAETDYLGLASCLSSSMATKYYIINQFEISCVAARFLCEYKGRFMSMSHVIIHRPMTTQM